MIMILDDNQNLYTTNKQVGLGVGHGEADRTAARRKTRRAAAALAAVLIVFLSAAVLSASPWPTPRSYPFNCCVQLLTAPAPGGG